MNDEFTDTYSDDIIYLHEGRTALLTHPLRKEITELCNASFCRLYIVMMIGSIEAMLDRWKSRDSLNILATYFNRGRRVTNKDRVRNLRDAFIKNSIHIEHDVFDDYLAIKYLRDVIVHASWLERGQFKQEEVDWIAAREFPTDTRQLNEEHWKRISWVDQNMMFYIALTGLPNIQPRPDIKDISLSARPLPNTTGIIAPSQWSQLYWSNLERISAAICEQIEVVVLTPEYNWAKDFVTAQVVEALPHNEKKRYYYMAAKAAAASGFEPLSSLANHAENAAMCWSEYMRLIPEFRCLDPITVREVVELFRTVHDHRILPKNGLFPEWEDDIPENFQKVIIEHSFNSIVPLNPCEISRCHKIGAKAKRAISNITPLLLFSIQLPIVAPAHMHKWVDTATYIADVFEVGQSWYSFVEGQAFSRETVDFYRDMLKLLVADEEGAS